MFSVPRMLVCLVLTLVLMALSLYLQQVAPGSLLAVTLYKAHLMALGGWGGYWLDRGLFPYDRPHQYLISDEARKPEEISEVFGILGVVQTGSFSQAMLRRAIIVAACLVCVGLGA